MNYSSRSQAENGTDNSTVMTPLRVRQSIDVQVKNGLNTIDPGNVEAITASDGKVRLKRATVAADNTPNNGVVLEYSEYSGWGGQLYMGDNADLGLWWNGWNEGVRGTWQRVPMDIWYPVETIAIGSMTVLEDNGVFYNPTTGEVRIQWLSVRLDADYTGYNTLFYFRVNIGGTYQTLTPKGSLAFIPSNSGQTFYPCFVSDSGVVLRDNIANGTYLYFMTSYLH